jgi:hypothetical protein
VLLDLSFWGQYKPQLPQNTDNTNPKAIRHTKVQVALRQQTVFTGFRINTPKNKKVRANPAGLNMLIAR